jgi:cyclopropane fatty-acyl-phospholipid synthase-like methyltransferase
MKKGAPHTMIRYAFRLAAAIGLAITITWAAPSLAQSPESHHHSFGNAQSWTKVFDDPARDAWQKPHEVIQALGLAPNAVVADIGSGTGYFSVRLAHFVPHGRVYGIDTEPDMVKYLADRAKREGLANITSVMGAADGPRLPEKVDVVILVDVFHHISDREHYFRKLRDALKPGGRVAIIDFNESSQMGPPKSARIAPDQVKAEMNRAGYALAKEHTFLPNQYYLIFQPIN